MGVGAAWSVVCDDDEQAKRLVTMKIIVSSLAHVRLMFFLVNVHVRDYIAKIAAHFPRLCWIRLSHS